jgi:hypothetical protein
MRAIVVYESIYGNTHTIAEHIARGLGTETVVVPVAEATPEVVGHADLVVVGGPTHLHGMTWSRTRQTAVSAVAEQEDSAITVDPSATGPGLRDWMKDLGHVPGTWAAAFDTRVGGSPVVTGRASRDISRRLRHHHFRELTPPESFVVDGDSHLLPGEADRAMGWGAELARALLSAAQTS